METVCLRFPEGCQWSSGVEGEYCQSPPPRALDALDNSNDQSSWASAPVSGRLRPFLDRYTPPREMKRIRVAPVGQHGLMPLGAICACRSSQWKSSRNGFASIFCAICTLVRNDNLIEDDAESQPQRRQPPDATASGRQFVVIGDCLRFGINSTTGSTDAARPMGSKITATAAANLFRPFCFLIPG